MKISINRLKEILLDIPLNDFYVAHCEGIQYKNARYKYNCPVCGSKDNFAFHLSANKMHCFGCEYNADHIGLVEYIYQKDFKAACKQIAYFLGYELDVFETTVETPEEFLQREVTQKKFLEKKQLEEKQLQTEKQKTIEKLTLKADIYSKELESNWDEYKYYIEKIFPNQSTIFNTYKKKLLGWDKEHDSLVILNMDGNKCINIKHHQKYIWDSDKQIFNTTKRLEGKWFSSKNCTIKPFFKDTVIKENAHYILTEGEKDAINIIAIGGNVTTLGGATMSWEDHKEFFKDKTVYIAFDNDKAGYTNAIKRYKELKSITNDVYVLLFFQICGDLKKGYDISDLISEYKIKTYESLLNKIQFSLYRLTNEIIFEIAEYLELQFDDFDKINEISTQKTFYDICKEYINPTNIVNVKGELNRDELIDKSNRLKAVKKNPMYIEYKKAVFGTFSKESQIAFELIEDEFSNFFNISQDILITNTKQDISNMVVAFEKMCHNSSYTFARYQKRLCFWNGIYYDNIDHENVICFILNDWMKVAQVDLKKRLTRNAKEILENIEAKAVNLADIKDRYKEKRVINLLNGTLFITKRGHITFKPLHDKKHGATNLLNFLYDPNASCPKWKRFLNRVLPNEEEQNTLMEYIGYCLFPSHGYETFLILYGKSGANGKSVIMDTISNFFGHDNISSLDLQQFYNHELDALSNKLINLGSEIDPKGLTHGQFTTLKKIVSPKDKLTINPKNAPQYSIGANEKPKLIFSTNEKPNQGLDDAVFRRMLLLTFDEEIKDHEKIRDLSDRFKDELSGILNLALTNLANLIKNGSFTKSQRMRNDIEKYKDEVDPLRKYIEDSIQIHKDSIVPRKFLYAHYKYWCEEYGFKALNESNFGKRLKESMPKLVSNDTAYNLYHEQLDSRVRIYEGIYCNDDLLHQFNIKDKVIKTNSINFDIKSKQILRLLD